MDLEVNTWNNMEISWVNKKIKVKKSAIAGTGVFAVKRIPQGETIAVFGGYVVDMRILKKLHKKNPRAYKTITEIGYQVDDHLIFAPTSASQFSTVEYINHSCEPNCGFVDHITFTSMKDIEKGEEITMDYAICISSPLLELKCNCKSTSCRGLVGAKDWQLPHLQKKYKGYFQPYLAKKIKELNKK